eukprot:503847_1
MTAQEDEVSNHLQLYSQLVNMGFEEAISLQASQKCTDIYSALNWIDSLENDHDETQHNHSQNSSIDAGIRDEYKGCKIDECFAIDRIISMLKFYHINHQNYNEILKYLQQYQQYLIEDYHHILDKHLNEDKISKLESNKQFEIIYKKITETNNLSCDIKNCKVYLRNNRQRETTNIKCKDKHLAMYIDIIDTIHCYFLHSVDIGYRLIHTLKQNEQDQKNDTNECDTEMKQLRSYLSSKSKTVAKIRGDRRFHNSKFMTHISNDQKHYIKINASQHVDEKAEAQHDEKKQNVTHDITKEGYLMKQSLHLKKFRKRFIILRENHLFCYDNHKKTKITEFIKLCLFKEVKASETEMSRFEMIPKNKKDKIRVFEAESMEECEDWINTINYSMNPMDENESKDMDGKSAIKKSENVFCFGEYTDYWSKTIGIFAQTGKYESIKEEVITNKIYSISIDQFEAACNKAKYLLEQSPNIRALRCDYFSASQFKMKEYQPPTMEHILGVILYTDYDSLSFRFSQTFRKISENESDKLTKKRGNEFWNWRKTLIETVNAFGTQLKDSNIPVFYHGVSMVYFNSFHTTFNSPISTTTQLQIAYQFATQQGIILEVAAPKDDKFCDVTYFNCTFISSFANEDERVFIQPRYSWYVLSIVSIRNMARDENYKQYIMSMKFLQRLFTGNVLRQYHSYKEVDFSKECGTKINDVVAILRGNEDITCPSYVKKLLQHWTQTIKTIRLEQHNLQRLTFDIDFYEPNNEQMVRIDVLNEMFKHIDYMSFKVDYWSSELGMRLRHKAFYDGLHSYWKNFAEMLGRINQMSWSKLNTISFWGINRKEFKNFQELKIMCERYKWTVSKDFSFSKR